jgi:class 3 adenylate cyclase
LAADVAGYSRLMHTEEEATHARLTALLTDAVAPAIAEHGGRLVKNTGDGFLAEFPCAVEAIEPLCNSRPTSKNSQPPMRKTGVLLSVSVSMSAT